MPLNRRTAREVVMKALYAGELSKDSIEHLLETIVRKQLKEDKELLQFAEKLFIRSVRDTKELDSIITEFAQNWDIKRIAVIDRCTMRMALTELMAFPEIPKKVTINEAIDIVKRYSTPKSGRFINGILDSAANKLSEEGRIVKKGTGLLNESVNGKNG
jgi:N utilization substance protein B